MADYILVINYDKLSVNFVSNIYCWEFWHLPSLFSGPWSIGISFSYQVQLAISKRERKGLVLLPLFLNPCLFVSGWSCVK